MSNSIKFSNLEKKQYILDMITTIDLTLLISAPGENIVHRSKSMSLFGLDLSSTGIWSVHLMDKKIRTSWWTRIHFWVKKIHDLWCVCCYFNLFLLPWHVVPEYLKRWFSVGHLLLKEQERTLVRRHEDTNLFTSC